MTIIRTVLVDDHAMVRAGIRQFLEHSAHIIVVGEADDGVMAQTIITEHQPDVVLIDIKMPHMGGIELATWIHDHYPTIKMLMLSAYDDDPYILAALKAGVHGYALKNTSPVKLIQAVETVYQGQSSLDPTITTRVMGLLSSETRGAETDQLTDLSARELEVLQFVASGKTNKEIGSILSISGRTVQGHLRNIFQKLDVTSRTEAVVRAAALGLVELEL